jgi:hypothetical protein
MERVYENMPRSVFENIPGGVLWSVLGSVLRGCAGAIESNWDCTVKQAGSGQPSAIRSILQSMLGSMDRTASGSLLASLLYPS